MANPNGYHHASGACEVQYIEQYNEHGGQGRGSLSVRTCQAYH